MIPGKDIHLTELDSENAETIRKWINDPDIHTWMLSGHIPITKGQEAAFFEQSETTTDCHRFEIHRSDDGELLGICGLEKVDMLHRHAEIGIFIGETAEQNRGFGGDAIMTLMGFAFRTLGLNTVQINYIEGNERSAHLYTKLGFKPAGRVREYHYIRGAYRDLVVLDMTRAEYESLSA